MTLYLMIITCSQSGTNDYLVSYLLCKICVLLHSVSSVLQPKPALLLKKTGSACTPRTKECVFKGWKQETKESSAGHKKRPVSNPHTCLKNEQRYRCFCVSSLSNQPNTAEKTLFDQNDFSHQFISTVVGYRQFPANTQTHIYTHYCFYNVFQRKSLLLSLFTSSKNSNIMKYFHILKYLFSILQKSF